MKNNDTFGGGHWVSASILDNLNQEKYWRLIISKIPKSIEAYHLVMFTLVWSILIVIFGYLARTNIYWLVASCFVVVLQYITDAIDGETGRVRNTGLIRWGYFMDHFLDFIYLNAIFLSYYLIMEQFHPLPVILLLIGTSGFLVNAFLNFSVTNIFIITFLNIGPTELRLLTILLNVLLMVIKPANAGPLFWFATVLLWIGLVIVVFRTQRKIWALDMKKKREEKRAVKGKR